MNVHHAMHFGIWDDVFNLTTKTSSILGIKGNPITYRQMACELSR